MIEDGLVEGITAQNSPVYGAVETLAIHPTDPNVILLGSVNGGVWKTSNAMASDPNWQAVTDFLPSLSIGALAFDHADPGTIFAGIGIYSSFFRIGGEQAGVFVSHDTGVTWAPVAGNAPLSEPGINVSDIVANGPLVFVTADALASRFNDTGVFRSTDGGASFQHLSGSAPGLPDLAVSSFVADPTDPNRFYAAAYRSPAADGLGIFRTEDAGATWSKVTDAAIDALLSNLDNIRLAVNDNGTLFAGIVNRGAGGGQLAGIFRSQNHGTTFEDFGIPTTTEGDPPIPFGIHFFGQGALHFSFLAHPTNDDILFVGGDTQPGLDLNLPNSIGARRPTGRLFRSTAPGAWTSLTHSGTASNSAPHPDSRNMAFDLSGNIIEVDDGGVYRRSLPTTNSGDWTSAGGTAATGIGVTEMYSVAYDNHGHVILAGTQDNGTIEQTAAGTRAWYQIFGGDSGAVRVFDPSPTANSFRYSSIVLLRRFQWREFSPLGEPVGPPVYPALHVVGSGDKMLSDRPGTRFDANVFFNTTLAVNRVNAGWLVFGTKSLYETTDHGENVITLGGVTSAGGAPEFNDGIDNDGDGTIDEADEMRPQLIFGDTVQRVAYGGFKNGIAFPDVLYASAGGELRIRRAGGGIGNVPSLNSAYTAAAGPAALIRALTLAESDWETAFVGDIGQTGNISRVFWTFDGGVSWSQIPGLYPMDGGSLRALAEVETGSVRALFAGSRNGVFWTLDDGSGFGPWSEFGAGSLPNAPVRELEYDPIDDVLVVATLGRGAWEVHDVSTYLIIPEPATATLVVLAPFLVGLRRFRRPTRSAFRRLPHQARTIVDCARVKRTFARAARTKTAALLFRLRLFKPDYLVARLELPAFFEHFDAFETL